MFILIVILGCRYFPYHVNMNKFFTLLVPVAFAFAAHAQTTPTIMPFGKIDNVDLEMTKCDFEPDANAEVLFNKGDVYYDGVFTIQGEYHKRIKIFNDNGKDEANIRIEYYGGNRLEYVNDIQAETINLVNGKPEITKLDKKLIYTQNIDKVRSAIVFSMPNVKAGSVIEYKYKYHTESISNFPSWDFQQKIPVRYSELDTAIPDLLYFREISHIWQSYFKSEHSSEARSTGGGTNALTYNEEKRKRILVNIPSLHDEPYMSSYADNLMSLHFNLTSIKSSYGFMKSYSDTWAKVGGIIADDEDFGGQLKRKLTGEELIINKAKALKTDDEKIAFVFNQVKNAMKWDGIDRWYTTDGTYRAWEKKTGNSAEVNLILYHLLKQSGVKAYPMIVSTREHGRVDGYNTSLSQFNRAVVYVPVDTVKEYILDATGKYNLYNETPDVLLNSSGLYIDKATDQYDIVFITKEAPVRQVVIVTADILPESKITGTADISSFSYNKINSTQRYKTDGEKKYTDFIRDNDNNLKISSIKMNNLEIDTLPLTQNITFNLELTGSDGTYIYFNPNLFTTMRTNPFLSENRATDIDFGYLNRYELMGNYKMPAGYKAEALPKNVRIIMPDQSISFKRFVAEQDGYISVRYVIDHNKAHYAKDDYAEVRQFYKQMHEMLNEQIVLKKI
jgi:DNA-binding protein